MGHACCFRLLSQCFYLQYLENDCVSVRMCEQERATRGDYLAEAQGTGLTGLLTCVCACA